MNAGNDNFDSDAHEIYWRKQAKRAAAERRRLQPFCLSCAVLAVALISAGLAIVAFIVNNLPSL